MTARAALAELLAFAAATAALAAQDPGADYRLDVVGAAHARDRDDYNETHVQGGFRISIPKLGVTIRGENVLVLNDLEGVHEAAEQPRSGGGLPTRGVEAPPPRRRLTPEALRQRLERTLGAIGRPGRTGGTEVPQDALRLFRYLYCEGGIVVVKDGVEVVRCERLWISPLEDRIVVEDAELRYATPGADTLVVRAPRLVKQGPRWTGQDALLTTCGAGEPHAALAVGEVQVIERPGEFEVVAHGQALQVGGTNLLPVPDARFFTGSQSEFPIRRISAGYSNLLGAQLGVVVGLPWNGAGGALHELLTGRPASEFRGEWELGVGWIEARGFPLEGTLTYGAPGVYQGRTEGFWIDDDGQDLREIKVDYAGEDVAGGSRGVVRTENRVFLGDRTHLDLVAFGSSDEAVYPEFFIGPYRNEEVPETSAYLHHAAGNHLLTFGARFNANDFSYRDDRALATRFVEELPVATWQWLAEPVAETPWETPIVLDLETQVGQRRSNYDDKSGLRVSDGTLQADQLVELSMPMSLGAMQVRPYAAVRGTFFDETVAGSSEERIAWEGGIQFATRLSRTWSWLGADGEQRALRHVVAPRVTYRNRFHVDDDPSTFFQYDFDPNAPGAALGPSRQYRLGYDNVDLLAERELVRFELRNLLQESVDTPAGRQPRDAVFLDLAQDVYPDSGRDNEGQTLGLFYYDLLLRPRFDWMPFERFAYAVYGDHDWRRGMQTFDTELQFGKLLGCNWTVEYREDSVVEGAVGVGVNTELLDRWVLFGGTQRDLERDEWLAYSFGIVRNDHDWSLSVSAVYNPFSEDTTFRFEFVPRFGGMNAQRRDRWSGVDGGSRFAFDY